MADIKPGSRVRIKGTDLEATVAQRPVEGWGVQVKTTNSSPSWAYVLPLELVEVLSLPLPEEPPVGTYAVRRLPGSGDGYVWQHVSTGWLRPGETWVATWAELHMTGATVTVLVPAGEDQGERYSPLVQGNSPVWMHDCGETRLGDLIPGRAHWCAGCKTNGASWARLYVRRGSDAD